MRVCPCNFLPSETVLNCAEKLANGIVCTWRSIAACLMSTSSRRALLEESGSSI